MRLDKYLKISRVIKRRTLAKDIIDIGLVKVNGKQGKPSTDIKENDIIELSLGERILTIKVLSLLQYARKDNASEMYQIINENVIKGSAKFHQYHIIKWIEREYNPLLKCGMKNFIEFENYKACLNYLL